MFDTNTDLEKVNLTDLSNFLQDTRLFESGGEDFFAEDMNDDAFLCQLDDIVEAIDAEDTSFDGNNFQFDEVANDALEPDPIFNNIKKSMNGVITMKNEHRDTTVEEDTLVLFQQTLNRKLESLLLTMQTTEQSRNILAAHSPDSLNSLDNFISQNSLQSCANASEWPTFAPVPVPSIMPLGMSNSTPPPNDTSSAHSGKKAM